MKKKKPVRVIVFSYGNPFPGAVGSGLRTMVEYTRTTPVVLYADIVAAVSPYQEGSICKECQELGVPFESGNVLCREAYERLFVKYRADFAVCFNWHERLRGLDGKKVVNIHPGPVTYTLGLTGMHIHEEVMRQYWKGVVNNSEICMYFGTEQVDNIFTSRGVFFRYPVPIRPHDSAETLARRATACMDAHLANMLDKVFKGLFYYHRKQAMAHDHGCKIKFGLGR